MDTTGDRARKTPARPNPLRSRKGMEAVSALLLRLGASAPEAVIERLVADPSAMEDVCRELAGGASIEKYRKLATTSNIMESGRVEADYAYVGLPDEAQGCDFDTGFRDHMAPRLGKRAESFAVMFDHLRRCERPLIVETGCLRVPDNWEGDGQSTFQFDWFAREHAGQVVTVDINPDSIDSSRRACSGVTSTILNDSVAALHMLGSLAARPAALIYLDSFDLDTSNPMPSAIHHATEMMAARGLIGPGTLICVDDFDVPPLGPGGKGLIVDQFMHGVRADVLFSGYQKVWRVAA
ncbi:hypothetical protein AA103196_1937 [Ameyamaea chiangmaiensis NBRC 103196]|uniref:Uncharacterized protein n=1 Tax=Ameyamaea chiangmaiensis TaxID=442969 RepID=A0A850PA57_9PROT|nr:hypothetical protein [Ameyamaea chiangmaiensis]MBS4073798.1 hypothetical protein [Ameyamaea chiangmaiensis]NVN39206.1 hypothetical protein [Ameyamaea chiangmaiensis]GBQ68410.1 hypothetical protein AA103196_1937 [Ameyamaea chiangmaiensis NBRC 103196]